MKKLAMGIDIGGTNTAFGLVDEDGNVVAESKISTEKFRYFDDYKTYIETLAAAMKEIIATVLSLPTDTVNVKATTEEHLGFTGEGLGIAAHAVCLLFRA